MAQKYGTILTPLGLSKVATAIATDTPVEILYGVLGDGNGSEYLPVEGQTELKRIVYESQVNTVYVDSVNPNWVVVEFYIPETVGGWTIREIGIRDAQHNTLAIGTYPSTYKPVLAEGAATGTYIKFIVEVSNAAAVTLKIDPSIVLATRKYVDDSVNNHAKQTNVHGATYTKDANRLMIRNADGRVQAAKPVVVDDVARLQEINEIYESLGQLTDTGVPIFKNYIGDGTTTRFAMQGLVSDVAPAVLVTLDGVEQLWSADYSVALDGTPGIVFVSAPASGVEVHLRTMVTLTQIPLMTPTRNGIGRADNDTILIDADGKFRANKDALSRIPSASFDMGKTASPQSLPSRVLVKVNLDKLNFDTTNFVAGCGANVAQSKWVCPQDGIYLLMGNCDFGYADPGGLSAISFQVYVQLIKNGAVASPIIYSATVGHSVASYSWQTFGMASLKKNDTIEMYVKHYAQTGTTISNLYTGTFTGVLL